MNPFQSAQASKVMVGNDAGWALGFYPEEGSPGEPFVLRVEDYYASIEATLPEGLGPGSYTFTIEGMTDDHYRKLPLTADAQQRTLVRLYLYWRDTNSSVGGFMSSVAGLTDLTARLSDAGLSQALVAELVVRKVSRRLGTRKYETVITAVERVFHRLATTPLGEPAIEANKYSAAVTAIGQRAKVNVLPQGFNPDGSLPVSPAPPPGSEVLTMHTREMCVEPVRRAATAVQDALRKYGRGMLLIRDGKLYFGPRQIPLKGTSGEGKPLTLSTGLLESELQETTPSDPYAPSDTPRPERRQFKLTLKGRPDLKPGDLVTFDVPPEEAAPEPRGLGAALGEALAGAFIGPLLPSLGGERMEHPTTLYVTSVQHRLGRTSGFVTFVTGVELTDPSNPWDSHSSGRSRADAGRPSRSASSATDAAQSIVHAAQAAADARTLPEVAEVRQTKSQPGGAAEPPEQTQTVWRGLVPGDGLPHGARRLAIERNPPAPVPGVAYASPFAWGKYGLILPRYPGTRVLLAYRNGQENDPVDIGALWGPDVRPSSRPGDWWLILPAAVPASDRASVPATVREPPLPSGDAAKATNDLIDADGNRVIEVGELTIRVGAEALKQAGERPTRGEAGSVTIEHAKEHSQIVMRADGSVTIKAKNIELDASGGTISLKADRVDVQVSDKVDIHG